MLGDGLCKKYGTVRACKKVDILAFLGAYGAQQGFSCWVAYCARGKPFIYEGVVRGVAGDQLFVRFSFIETASG